MNLVAPVRTVFVAFLALLLAAAAASRAGADSSPTALVWPDATVASSEGRAQGYRQTKFSLANLVDNDARTTWVFRGGGKTWRDEGWSAPRAVSLAPARPVLADGLWLMNGDNRRPDLFLRNDRITRVRLILTPARSRSLGERTVKETTLADAMGWHKIALPRQAWRKIEIVFVAVKNGTGPSAELCASEITLARSGKPLSVLRPPALAVFQFGGEAESLDSVLLQTRTGAVLARDEAELFGGGAVWSQNGRFVASVERRKAGGDVLWIGDARRGRVVRRVALPQQTKNADYYVLRWQGERTVAVATEPPTLRRSVRLQETP